jgi:hypothetical protein
VLDTILKITEEIPKHTPENYEIQLHSSTGFLIKIMAKKKKGKDPAFMMYSGDFLSGTFTMNYEQRGKFITLMCIQHQKGYLTSADMKSVLNEEDYLLAEKFYKANDGNWYNQKMTDVINERKEYTANRLKNFQKKDDVNTHIDNHKDSHMELHTGDEDEDEDKDVNEIENQDKDIVYSKASRQEQLANTMANTWEQITKTI